MELIIRKGKRKGNELGGLWIERILFMKALF
jgi:hypothetical protein